VSAGANGGGNASRLAGPLVVVRVEDAIEPRLAARTGATYQSPPQPRGQAMTLVRLLLGCAGEPVDGAARWVVAIAGGRRTVTVVEEPVR
jgi:hypothetical protein